MGKDSMMMPKWIGKVMDGACAAMESADGNDATSVLSGLFCSPEGKRASEAFQKLQRTFGDEVKKSAESFGFDNVSAEGITDMLFDDGGALYANLAYAGINASALPTGKNPVPQGENGGKEVAGKAMVEIEKTSEFKDAKKANDDFIAFVKSKMSSFSSDDVRAACAALSDDVNPAFAYIVNTPNSVCAN